MNSPANPVARTPLTSGQAPASRFMAPATPLLCALIVVLLTALSGCATREPPPPPPPAVVVPQSTWMQIDGDIAAASLDARAQSSDYARDVMQRWRERIYQRTDEAFIPWFSGYWTRQWLSMKVTWYKLNAGGERDPTVERLAAYLQEQYHDRVLAPVAREINPDWITGQTVQLYIRLLREHLQGMPPRYGVPLDQFDGHLQEIPAIALAPPPAHNASLYQLARAEPIDGQPAYAALVARLHSTPGRSGDWTTDAGISSVARQTSETLVTELTTRSVAGAISAAVGRVAGMLISLGTTGFTAMLREKQRPEMENQLRQNLHATFDEEWLDLLHNPETGVLAGVNHISGQIESSLAERAMQPLRDEEPAALAAPELEAQPPQPQAEEGNEDASYRLW